MTSNPEMWTVRDTNARTGPRVHEMADGATYSLLANADTPVPIHHAVVFLRDAAFVVKDQDGLKRDALPSTEIGDPRQTRPNLEPGQCIAAFGELRDDALLARARIRPGGEAIGADTPRADIIIFLLTARMTAETPEHERPRQTSSPETNDRETEQLGSAAVSKLLPDPLMGL